MGHKYETKIIKYPTPRGIDYDAITNAVKPRKDVGGSFGSP
jgi:5,10-methylene-tetrahydrofolate dehydrogenase/methenyl tetrahydrofolate cyclohydrolase